MQYDEKSHNGLQHAHLPELACAMRSPAPQQQACVEPDWEQEHWKIAKARHAHANVIM